MNRSILTAVTLLAATTLLPFTAVVPAGAATGAVDTTKVGATVTSIKTATGSPDGIGLYVGAAATGSGLAARSTLAYVSQSSTASIPLTDAVAPSVVAASAIGTSDAVLVGKGTSNTTAWNVDLVTSWAGGVATRVTAPADLTAPSGPVAAVAAPRSTYAYVELSNGTIVSVRLTDGVAKVVATVSGPSLTGTVATAKQGVLAIAPDASTLFVGTASGTVGAVATIALDGNGGGTIGSPITLDAGTPTALLADGTGSTGSLFVTTTSGIGRAALDAASVSIAAPPVSGMVCGALGIDTDTAGQRYLDCVPTPGSTDLHLYRFKIPASGALLEASGMPLSVAATGVWGVATGGVLVLETNGTISWVSPALLSGQPALTTFPQPPSDVAAAPITTTEMVAGKAVAGYGIFVSWKTPAVGLGQIQGYQVSAAPASGGTVYCSDVTTKTTTECLIRGSLVAGTAYTISVQSLGIDGSVSAAVLAPYKVTAGTPGPVISDKAVDTGTATAPSCAADPSKAIVVPTYALAGSGTVASPAIAVSWPGISWTEDDQLACDPFTHQRITMGKNPVTYYVVSAIDTATNTVAKTLNVPLGTATTQSIDGTQIYRSTLTGLTAGKTYVFTVAANGSAGTPNATTGLVPFSATWTGTPTYAVPDLSALSNNTADGASARIMDPTAGTGTYVPGGVKPVAYVSQALRYSNATPAPTSAADVADPSLIAAAPTAPVFDPSVSTKVSATPLSAAIAVTWDKQANYTDHVALGQQDVVGYTATASYTDSAGKVTTKTCTTAAVLATSCTITGLTNGNLYTVSVQAKSGVLGPAATLVDGTGHIQLVMPAGVPGIPTAVKATIPQVSPNASNQQWGTAVVTWTPPTDNGGKAITGYEIVAIPADNTLANTFTEYVCDTSDQGAVDLINAQADSTPALEAPVKVRPADATRNEVAALPISPNAVGRQDGEIFPTHCDVDPNKSLWGTNGYTFPTGSLSSQTSWTFKVAAHNAFGSSPTAPATWGALSAASTKVTTNGAPMPPTKVTTTVSASAITATWVAPAVTGGWALKGYQANLYQYDEHGDTTRIASCAASTGQTSCSVPRALHAPDGFTYFFTVQVFSNGFGQPAASSLGSVTLPASNESAVSNTVAWYDAPPKLRLLTATPGDKTILVTWDPVPDPSNGVLGPSNSPITLYTISATTGTTTKTCTAVPPATSCVITGLTNGASYTVSGVQANPGASSVSSPFKDVDNDHSDSPATAVSPGTIPDAPTGVSATAGDQGVDVWWTAPKSTGGVKIDYYTVSIVPGNRLMCRVDMPLPMTCHIDGLVNGVTYTATVTAHNWFGTSIDSAPSAAFKPYGLAQPPLDVQAFPEDGSVTATWDAPYDNGGSAVTGYTATARPTVPGTGALKSCTTTAPTTTVKTGTGTTATTTTTVTGPAPLTCTITGLTNGAEYTVDVVASTLAGTSSRSGPSIPFVPIGAPDAPTGVFAYSDIGGSSSGGPTTLHVTWNPSLNDGGSAVVRYTARASNGATCIAEGGLTSCDIDGLRQGVSYTVTVTATNLDGYVSKPSVASPPSTPAGPPSVPTDVMAIGAQNAITVSWTPSTGNGAAVTQYVITLQPTGQVVLVSGTRHSAIIKGLDPGTTYTATVQAQSGPVLVSGLSKRSNGAKPFVTPNRVAKPQVKAVKTGARYKILVGWKAPDVSGAPITGYLVRLKGGKTIRVKATKHKVTFKRLKPQHRYSFTVVPLNQYGVGQASPAASVRTRG